jgi:hypothetical protein
VTMLTEPNAIMAPAIIECRCMPNDRKSRSRAGHRAGCTRTSRLGPAGLCGRSRARGLAQPRRRADPTASAQCRPPPTCPTRAQCQPWLRRARVGR